MKSWIFRIIYSLRSNFFSVQFTPTIKFTFYSPSSHRQEISAASTGLIIDMTLAPKRVNDHNRAGFENHDPGQERKIICSYTSAVPVRSRSASCRSWFETLKRSWDHQEKEGERRDSHQSDLPRGFRDSPNILRDISKAEIRNLELDRYDLFQRYCDTLNCRTQKVGKRDYSSPLRNSLLEFDFIEEKRPVSDNQRRAFFRQIVATESRTSPGSSVRD